MTGPYVRFIVSDPGRDPATFYGAADDALVPGIDFADAVSVDFRHPNLPYRLERIRAAGSAVIVENVPGPGHGEIVLGALRELADVLITDYRVDQARHIVGRPDVGAFFGPREISADARVLTIRGIRGGAIVMWDQEFGGAFQDRWFAANILSLPNGVLESAEGLFFGPYVSFASTTYAPVLPVVNSQWSRAPSRGFLFSFVGTLPRLSAGLSSGIFGSWPGEDPSTWNAGVSTQGEELVGGLAT